MADVDYRSKATTGVCVTFSVSWGNHKKLTSVISTHSSCVRFCLFGRLPGAMFSSRAKNFLCLFSQKSPSRH